MGDNSLIFHNISFSYPSSPGELIRNFSADPGPGWTGIIGPNGSGKTTLLKLATGVLAPDSGRIFSSGRIQYCRQRTDHPPDNFQEFLGSSEKSAYRLMGRLDIDPDWATRWESLSHGERKRAQIALALYEEPDILAVDEPTNHLDSRAGDWIMETLALFRGTGLLVSHDRALLDRLCKRCIFIDPPDITLISGNYSQSFKQKQQMEHHLEKRHFLAKQRVKQLTKEAERRRKEAGESDKRTSKKGVSPKDHDAKEKRNLARLTGKDGCAGKRLNQIGGRLSQARETLAGIRFKKQYKTGFSLTGSRAKRDILLHLKPGRLPLSKERALFFDDLYIRPQERIGITGPNGCGKTTLIKKITAAMDQAHICYLPQEIDLSKASDIMDEIRQLPQKILGEIMVNISRLGSRPQRILETAEPSPGEVRKILLARSISMHPHIIVMDEPTNHLDLPSVELLETALESCSCSLLLVSHDPKFIGKLTAKRWEISQVSETMGNHRKTEFRLEEKML